MKKLFSIVFMVAAMLLGKADALAQSQFRKGDVAINLDYCLGSVSDYDGATNGFCVMGEYGFMNVINEKGTISAGLILGAGFHNDTYKYNYGDYHEEWNVKFSRIRIGTRGALHYSFIPQLDTYGGINFLFVDIETAKVGGDKDTGGKFVCPSIVAGCRYMFSPAFGVNFETTWDRFQHIALGFTFKF